jgi:hypothetical protein
MLVVQMLIHIQLALIILLNIISKMLIHIQLALIILLNGE